MPISCPNSHRLAINLVATIAIVAFVSAEAAAKDKWINLHTKNFNIVSNADEGPTRKLASNLEQFRYVFSQLFNIKGIAAVPVTVIVFKSDGAFKPFKPLYNGKPANVAGYFQRGEDENMIALNIAGNEERPMAIIYHEYTHLMTSYTPRPWPAWLLEGLAELYSSFAVDQNKVTLGAPISSHVHLLREKQFVPIQTLFQVDHKSPIYNERDKQSVFYAESWALAHYLMFGDKTVRQAQLVEFVRVFNSGVEWEKAFTQAFKTDYATMEKALRRYIGNDTYTIVNYVLNTMESQWEMTLEPLGEAEVQYYLGDLLLHTNRPDEAVAYFDQARTLDSNLARPYEGLGIVAIRHNDYELALQHFKNAVARNSQSHLAHYYYAQALMRDAFSGRTGTKPETSVIVGELKKAIKLMPGFAGSYHLMAEVYLADGENLEEAERALKTAIQLDPQNKYFALTLAQLQIRQGSYDQARKTLGPLIALDMDPGLKTSAQSMMGLIETYSAAGRTTAEGEAAASSQPSAAEAKEVPRLRRRGDSDQGDVSTAGDSKTTGPRANEENAADPARGASMRIEGTKIAAGVLAAIECDGTGMILVLISNGRTIRFAVSDPVKLQFYSQDPDFHANIGCGPINHAAFVHFKPAAAPKSGLSGDAVAVEFRK